MYEMYPLIKKGAEEFLLDVSPVGKDFPIRYLREYVPYTVIQQMLFPCISRRRKVS